MSAFVRTLTFGLAALCLLLVAMLVTASVVLHSQGSWREAARNVLLSSEERELLDRLKARPPEPPLLRTSRRIDTEEAIERIAEQVGRSQIQDMILSLRNDRRVVDEQRQQLMQELAELRIAQAAHVEAEARLQARERAIQDAQRREAEERARFAEVQAEAARQIQAVSEVERTRLRALAQLYENQRDDAWASLQRLDVREVARILSFMDPKRAARIMVLATQDENFPSFSVQLHQAMKTIDLEGITGDQVRRLAQLYTYMEPAQVLRHLDGVPATEVAAILKAMEGNERRRAAILTAMRAAEDPREQEVSRLLLQATRDSGAAP